MKEIVSDLSDFIHLILARIVEEAELTTQQAVDQRQTSHLVALQIVKEALPLNPPLIFGTRLAQNAEQFIRLPWFGKIAKDLSLVDCVDDGLHIAVARE